MTTLYNTETAAPQAPAESRRKAQSRHRKRVRLTVASALVVTAFTLLVALIVANTDKVRIDWLFGTSTAQLVWIVVSTAVLGWLLGMATSALLQFRTRSAMSRRTQQPPIGR